MAHDVTEFRTEVIEKSRTVPVLVDFWAPWCGPCRVLGPVLERLAAEAGGRWALAKLNTEEQPELAEAFGITSIPNVKLFVDGRVADEFVGALPEPEVRRWLERALPSPHRGAVAKARERIEGSRFGEAAAVLGEVLAADPANPDARLALAEARLHLDPAAVEEALAGLDDEPGMADRIEALRTLARLMAALDRPDSLPGSPVRPRFLAGLEAVRTGDWATALEAFIEVLGAERGYAGGAAKEAGRAIFLLLGWGHPVCERYHRRFASAVNV